MSKDDREAKRASKRMFIDGAKHAMAMAEIADLKTECSELNEDLVRVMNERNEAEERTAQVLEGLMNAHIGKHQAAYVMQLWREGRK